MKKDVLDKGYVRVVDVMGSDLSVVNAARVSYNKESPEFTERDSRLLRYLWENDHTSPFRHASICYEVYAPLLVARQWWKYAVASSHIDDQNGWNESSRRYITEDEEFYLPKPHEWRLAPEDSKQGSGQPMDELEGFWWSVALAQYYEQAQNFYERAINEWVAPEQARLFLPAYGMYVRWRWTTSLQGVIHFLQQRMEHDAQFEIRQYAEAVREITADKFPHTFTTIFGGKHDRQERTV